jgi:Right handed beta helix region
MFNRKFTTSFAATMLAAALAVLAVGPSARATTLPLSSCGQAIQTSVFLTKDLDCAWTGMFIVAPGITIDLKGHVLKGDGVAGHIGIADFGGYDHLTIKNGVIRNFDIGVLGQNDAHNMTITNVVTSGNKQQGIFITGDSASITSSTASGNGGPGISVLGRAASIKSSTVSGNVQSGIFVSGNDSISITSSSAVGNGAYGVRVSANANVSVKSTSAMGNALNGFYLEGDETSVSASTASGNAGHGLVVVGASVSVKATKASGNGGHGFWVSGDAATLNGNRAEGNGFPGGTADGVGLGILVSNYTVAPQGTNVARGNDDAAGCSPASLC